jgi:hypothetical protein
MAFTLKDRGGTNNWINHVLEIFSLFMLTVCPFSFLLILTTDRSTVGNLLYAPASRDEGTNARVPQQRGADGESPSRTRDVAN